MLRITLITLFATVVVAAQSTSGWKLIWSDEFNGTAGQLPDATKWTYDLGYNCCGNNEIETYTKSTSNIFLDGKGNLVIRALRDSSGNYTSGRIKTQGLFSFTYGRVEARMRLPFGKGIWPAFWTLGTNIDSVGWPQCGEVDIMENFGPAQNDLSKNHGSLHGPGYTGALVGEIYTLPFGETIADDYHIYTVEWAPDSMKYYFDGTLYETQTPSTIPGGTKWVFNNQPEFLILNQAIGGPNSGDFIGTPDATTPFPSDMFVDWVRVYQTASVTADTPVITPGRVLNAASYLGSMAPGGLVALWGTNLADKTYVNLFDSGNNAFPTVVAGVSVLVNGVKAPLTYVSATQINFQVPWGTPPGPQVSIQVVRNAASSNIEPVTIAAATAPSVYIGDYNSGAVIVSECLNKACALWGNGFGPKNGASQDGTPPPAQPSSLAPLKTKSSCALTIGGLTAKVDYCGAAPGLIIDQLNFEYPSGLPSGQPWFDAYLTVGDTKGHFRIPPLP